MEDLRFEWDEKKNEINIKKHGVSFEEASTSFYDDLAIIIPDEKHSEDEERFTLIGKSENNRILYVSLRKSRGSYSADFCKKSDD